MGTASKSVLLPPCVVVGGFAGKVLMLGEKVDSRSLSMKVARTAPCTRASIVAYYIFRARSIPLRFPSVLVSAYQV